MGFRITLVERKTIWENNAVLCSHLSECWPAAYGVSQKCSPGNRMVHRAAQEAIKRRKTKTIRIFLIYDSVVRNLMHFDGKVRLKLSGTLAECNWTQRLKNGIITHTLA